MLAVQCAQKAHIFWRILEQSQGHFLRASRTSLFNRYCQSTYFHPLRQDAPSVVARPILSSCYSCMASKSETFKNSCNGNTSMAPNIERPYQVVVAATREMGIGKDGMLPWNLPSDLKFFKEVTTTTSDPGKRNAVIMGRRTWESIPLKYRPLPHRLNVVLTRSGRLEDTGFEDLVVCPDFPSALKLLGEPPHSISIEKVFVIGGGQVLKEALNGPHCEAIHLTDIETNIECDTFIPRIDLSLFRQWCSRGPMVENSIQFSFVTFVRAIRDSTEVPGNGTRGSTENK